MSTQSKNAQEIFYHYTSQAGIIGICSSKMLWASNIHHLNDREEFKLGLKMAKEAFATAGHQKDALLQRFCAEANGQLEQWGEIEVYVVSFSKKRDALSQWRGYGRSSAAVALGFSKAQLEALGEFPMLRFRPCVYEYSTQRNVMNEAVRGCLEHFAIRISSDGFNYENARTELFDYVRGYIAANATLVKHHSFSEEEEWRLVLTTFGSVDFKTRPGADFIVPYAEIPLRKNNDGYTAFEEIVIGPTNEPLLAERGLHALLNATKCHSALIAKTSSPFRP